MEERIYTIRIEGKEEFLSDLSEENAAAQGLKETLDAAAESAQRLNEQLDKLKNR